MFAKQFSPMFIGDFSISYKMKRKRVAHEFAKRIPKNTLIIFTTAFAEFALDSYEVDDIDYLLKPIETERFGKAVEKAESYHRMLLSEEKNLKL